ncbi:MAG: DUF3160 domain-containing protein [Deltaproteobacteria bacterium]|nr:DUF3160 domain-containing protein [Deltaproteobacteria bacterium]
MDGRLIALATALALSACGKKAGPAADAAPTATAATAATTAPEPAADAATAAPPSPTSVAPAEDAATPPAPAPTPGAISPTGVDARRPRVSPDGTRVLFHAGPDGKRDIMIVGIDGAGASVLAADPADDHDPSWAPDGKRVLFSSNRGGRHDLWVLDLEAPDAAPQALGAAKDADATEPTLSSLRYTFSAVNPDFCTSEGANAEEVDSYEKLAYTRVTATGKEVWFRSLNGKHAGRLSPAGASCWGPRYSADGLSLLMTCADGGGERRVIHDTRAAWDQELKAALVAVGWRSDEPTEEGKEPPNCPDADAKQWDSDACLKKLPRRYATHAPAPVPDPTGAAEARGYSTNHTLVLAAGPSGAVTRERREEASWHPLDVPGAGDVADVDWSPDGGVVVLEQRLADGSHGLVRAPTSYYLQDVKDLDDYPELWGAGRSALLQDNRFVVRPGDDKEFFHAYDKVMYARRGAFVTADATLQVVRDEIAAMLKAAEVDAAESLRALTKALMDLYAARPDTGNNRYLATQLAVAWAALEAAHRVPAEEEEMPFEEPPADAPPAQTPVEKLKGELPKVIADVPAAIRDEVGKRLAMALAHEGFIEVVVPGRARPVPVDFSQMKPRGHYAESTLVGYFIAMKWLAMVPFPLDASAVELVRLMEKEGLMQHWDAVDQLVGGFMGRPVDVTVSHVRAQLEKDPSILEPTFDKDKALKTFKEALGDLGTRGLEAALADDAGGEAPTPELSFVLFPMRLGMDVPTFTGLTHPAVPGRGLPSAVDVLAAMGVPAADRIARAQAVGQEWQAEYDKRLDALRGKTPGEGDALWAGDLYHAWLALLGTMARPLKTPAEARLLFTDKDAWRDRLVSGALGGYAQLKHDAVLYAFQDFSAQCDGGMPIMVFVEQPILPSPRGFVEPNPAFFRAAAALAKRAYDTFADGEEPDAASPWGDVEDEEGGAKREKNNARTVAERLAKIADKQLARKALTKADHDFLRTIGGTFESLFLGTQKTSQGADTGKGRLERGIALVTDIHTNVTNQVALQIGIGRVDKLFVAVPDDVGARMTEGGVFGFYEFTQPISDRLTDDQWHERIVNGSLPPRPSWVSSFFEARAR